MTNGIAWTIEPEGRERTLSARLPDALGAVLFCAALWGGLLRMADLSAPYLLLLLPGCAGALLSLPPKKKISVLCLGALAAAAAGMALLHPRAALDGACVLLNRLCQASQARQSYSYALFSVSAPPLMQDFCLWYALAALGLLSGAVCGAAVLFRARWAYLALLLGFGGAVAYLGVSPGGGWLFLMAAALALLLRGERTSGRMLPCAGVMAAAAILWVGISLLFPGESPALSAWNEAARDALALRTSAVVEEQVVVPAEEYQPQPEELPFETEETPGEPGGSAFVWPAPPAALWVILLLAAALFLPSIASDRLRRRRTRNRQGLDDPDPGTAIRCMFLYAMRWLRLGGLPRANVPFSARAEEIGEKFSPALREQFEQAVPLWQEAAYSGHPMDGEQRERMSRFLACARQEAWSALDRRGRFRAHYIDAL